jgi:hypothetical protein
MWLQNKSQVCELVSELPPQWPEVQALIAWAPRSWVQIQVKAWLFVLVFRRCVVLRVRARPMESYQVSK